MPTGRRVKYLNNRDLLDEIHKSKCSFSSFTQVEYKQYDIILPNINGINTESITEAKRVRAKRLGMAAFAKARGEGNRVIKLAELIPENDSILDSDIVIRIMSFDHVPLAPGRKKSVKSIADAHERVNFPPFQHWKFDNTNTLECVGKSHWRGDLTTGAFSKEHGRISENLGRMFIKLSERYAQRSNWRGYTYVEEMRGQALLQLSQIGLQFDESKSSNPFAYFTAAVTNSFTKVLNTEKKNQNIRDDLLEDAGLIPSLTRQNSQVFAVDIAKQAEYYKQVKLPSTQDDPLDELPDDLQDERQDDEATDEVTS